MRLTLFLAVALFAAVFAAPVSAAEQTARLGGLSVTVWTPDGATGRKLPIIIFSHGFHGCATQSEFLTQALARDGYIVFAPNHSDAVCKGKGLLRDPSAARFGQPEQWSDQTFINRRDDIVQLIAAIKADARYRDSVDWNHFGLAGHSLGGYTVLALGGAWKNWKIDGVKGILALSPYAQPFVLQQTMGDIDAPVMFQGGTRDVGISPSISKEQGAYDLAPPPKYYIEFNRAAHFAWTNLNGEFHDLITVYSIAFLDHYIKGARADPALTEDLRGVADMRFASELGSEDEGAEKK